VRSLAWDHSVVLDMLLAPGGRGGGADIREYMLRSGLPAGYCPPRHQAHFERSFLESNGIL